MLNPVRLIGEVKKRPGLYDLERPLDRHDKILLWKDVGAALFRDWETYDRAGQYDKVLLLQKRWRSLRDAYNRELRARRLGTRRHRKVYIYFKKMSFLGGFDGDISSDTDDDEVDPRVTHMEAEDMNMPIEELDDVSEEIVAAPKKKRRVKKEKKKEVFAPTEEVDLPMFQLDSNENDSDKLFLLSFLPEMKQLSLDIKMWVRSQIANVMQEAVSCHLTNSTPNSSMRENGRMSIKRQRNESFD
ncbi:uncharacterized protein LOC126969845 [Leptidea sinapis]|uniref:BESS domain-containing protein n=1 Tax=Leptidea sinapis TaxID=189913 RepID=A0A5E4QPT2_9NEOP|nr:uncharacterized protein LOC126969845 [Leptidea sinapis]VVC99623.1 unnamed protein product [Leptidea sinapis]